MVKNVFFMINSVDINRGGLTKACLQQANISADLGYNTSILTFNYNGEYSLLVDKIYNDYGLNRNIPIINMYEYFQNEQSITKQVYKISDVVSDHDILEKVPSKNAYRVYQDGIYKQYFTYRSDQTIKGIDHFNDMRYRVRNEVYTPDGYIGKVTYMDLVLNKPRQMVFKNSKNNVYLSKWVNPENSTAHRVMLFSQDEITHVFKNDQELKSYFVECVIRDVDNPILISDSRNTDDVLTKVNHKQAYKIIRLHSNHIKAPFNKDTSDVATTVQFAIQNLNHIDCLLVLTDRQRKDIVERFGHEDKVQVIPHGIEATKFKSLKFFKPIEAVIISRLVALKQISHAIDATKVVIQKFPNFKLKIYGSGTDEANLKNKVKELKLEDHVEFMGYTTNAPSIYKNASFSIVTSRTEGFSLAILESLANGCPVVSYNFNYGPADIITDGEDGFIVERNNIDELAQKMEYLIDNPKILNQMSKHALKNVKSKFDKHNITKEWQQFFESI